MLSRLKVCLSADRPADQAFRLVDDPIHLVLGKLFDRTRQVAELDRFQRLDAKGDLIDDPAKAVAGTHEVQQRGVIFFRRFRELTAGRHPLDPGDV